MLREIRKLIALVTILSGLWSTITTSSPCADPLFVPKALPMTDCQHHDNIRAPAGRRAFLADMGMGFVGLALGAMLQRDGYASESRGAPRTGLPHFPPKA